jgi:hypothetical protein
VRSLAIDGLVTRAAGFRPGALATPVAATKLAMRELARRWQLLDAEVGRLDGELDRLVAQAAPQLTALLGVGTDVAGALLVAAGDNPSGCAARPASRACAAWRRWRPPRARRSVTGWTGAGTGRPTTPCGAS